MIRYAGTVVYEDGGRAEFEGGMQAARAWEAYAARHELPLNPDPAKLERFPVHTWMLVIAHASLAIEEGVEAWGRRVAGIDDWEAGDRPPILPAPSTGSNASLPSDSVGASAT